MSRSQSSTTRRHLAPPAGTVDAARYLSPTHVSTLTPLPVVADPDWPRVRGYDVLAVVGRGGMGVVYQARHRELQRTVAIKTLRGAALCDPEFRERFQAEATAVARLQHPNIIQVFEVGTVDSRPGEHLPTPYIALEFVDGGDLTRLTDAPQPPKAAARLVEKLARAAHAAHQVGVVHRDLKPENVLLTPAGEPKVADFGVAKRLEPETGPSGRFETQAGIVVGTPEYMAPEQTVGVPATPAVDTYALGVVLYELLTGRVPFRGQTAAETMSLVRVQDPVSPRRLQPGLPKDLETICLKCLEKTPGRRYESAEALADDLARWADGRTIRARAVGPAERAARWANRNPSVAGLSAAVVVLALAGVFGVVWEWRQAQHNAVAAAAAAAEARGYAKAERWERYRADIVAASSALRLNDARAARRALMAAPEEHRGWEWRHAVGRLDTSRRTFTAPESGGTRAHVGQDGRRAAVVAGRSVHVWDTDTGRRIGGVTDRAAIEAFTLSPDGLTLACSPVGAGEDTVQLWDVSTGRMRAVLRGHAARVVTAHFSPDGSRLASGALDGSVRVWEVATGAALRTLGKHAAPAGTMSFDATGQRLASPGTLDGTVRVWNVATGRLVRELADPGADLTAAVFSPTGTVLAVGETHATHRVRLWSLETGKPLVELAGHKNRVTHCEFSPDGKRFVTASLDQTARLWDVPSGKLLAELRGHNGKVFSARFNPDGRRLVTASQDQTVRLWDGPTGTALAVLHGHGGEVLTAGYHPDGRRVASAAWDGTARVWDADSGRQELLVTHADNKPVTSVAFHSDGKLFASLGRDKAVRLWDADTGAPVHHWPIPTHGWLDSRLAFSPHGDLLAAGDGDGGVRLFDIGTRSEVAVLRGHTDAVRDVAFSPDGRWLVSGADDHDPTVRVWDVARRQQVRVLTGHAERVYALAFDPTGVLLASGSTDGSIRLWDTASWEPVAVLKPDAPVYGLAFTPDGRRLAAGCADNAIRLWDVGTRQEVAGLTGHTDYAHAVAFSPDGRRLVSASGDTTLRVWDAEPGR